MTHGNLIPASLFVTRGGDWKLGGFDLLHVHGDSSSSGLRSLRPSLVPAQLRSPETAGRQMSSSVERELERAPAWCLDSWALGCLLFEMFNGPIDKPQQLTSPGRIPAALLKDYKRLLATSTQQRLNPQQFLESPFFDNEIVKVIPCSLCVVVLTQLGWLAFCAECQLPGSARAQEQGGEGPVLQRIRQRRPGLP